MTILVVDNDSETAESCAALLKQRLGLDVAWTASTREAVQILAERPIQVVVLDQRMPERSGTELLREMREINPYVRAIMLSGQASMEEVGSGYNLFNGFTAKQKIANLPDSVLRQCVEYQASIASLGLSEKVLWVTRRYLVVGPTTIYRLVRTDILDREYVDEDSWESYLQLEAGESRKYIQQRFSGDKMTMEEQSRSTLKGSIGLSATKQIAIKLEEALEDSYKQSREISFTATESVERTLSLPAEPASLTQVYVKSRHLSRAPIYKRLRAVISRRCEACGSVVILTVIIKAYTGFYATRHEDHTSDGAKRITDTGKVRVETD